MLFYKAMQHAARLAVSLFIIGLAFMILPVMISAASNIMVTLGFFGIFTVPFMVWAVWRFTFRKKIEVSTNDQ